MARFVMIVQSQAKEGQDEAYNRWYDDTHFHDILALSGVTGGRRLEHAATPMGTPGLPYLALYDIEADDPMSVMAELGERMAKGLVPQTDTIDAEKSVIWFYKVSDSY